MRIDFKGKIVDEPTIRIGHIGCGSHSFRNLFATYQFVPVELAATCDLDEAKAKFYARQFGAPAAYTDYRAMIEKEKLDAVVVCVNFDKRGRPLYPRIATECMNMGVNVFIEKPPAATAAEVELMMKASDETGKIVLCGLKRAFFQMTTKAKKLIDAPEFGEPMTLLLQREERIPTMAEMADYRAGNPNTPTIRFLDHFCHPASVMLYLFGMPQRMIYHRAAHGSGVATYEYDNGRVASMSFTHGGSGVAGGVERVTVIGTKYRTVVVENCRVICFQGPVSDPGVHESYGAKPSYFTGDIGTTTALWEPEFQLGQLYSKGVFLLGYYDELLEFARAIMEKRQPTRGTLEQCWQITHMFEQFNQGPSRMIELRTRP